MKKLGVATVVVLGCLMAAGVAQAVWLQWRLVQTGVDGELVDVGGRRIHLACTGNGQLTYVLEAGAVGLTDLWQWVRSGLEATARVCAYDRAGLGASDVATGDFAPENVRRDLKAVLEASGEAGPYVLMGHSLGGIFVRSFAAAYPDDVRALVLVDPSHEDQLDRFDAEMIGHFETLRRTVKVLSVIARSGLLNFWNPLATVATGLEHEALARARLYVQDPKVLAAASDELDAWAAIMGDRRRFPVSRSVPVLVVSAGAAGGRSAATHDLVGALHRDLAGRSAAGRHETIAGANHFTILTDRDYANRLAETSRRFVAQTDGP